MSIVKNDAGRLSVRRAPLALLTLLAALAIAATAGTAAS
jgi:hypothetical protein